MNENLDFFENFYMFMKNIKGIVVNFRNVLFDFLLIFKSLGFFIFFFILLVDDLYC